MSMQTEILFSKCKTAHSVGMVISQVTLTWSRYFLKGTVKEQEGDYRERGDQTSLGTTHDRNLTNLSKELKIKCIVEMSSVMPNDNQG